MIKMLQYKMYPAGELAVLRQLLLSENFHFLEVKFSIYLYRRVFVMFFYFLMKTCFCVVSLEAPCLVCFRPKTKKCVFQVT